MNVYCIRLLAGTCARFDQIGSTAHVPLPHELFQRSHNMATFIQRSEPSTPNRTHFERGDQYVLRLPESLSPREMPTSACCNWLSVDRMPYCSSPPSRTCNCCVLVSNDPSSGHCWTRTLREASGTSIEALEAARCFGVNRVTRVSHCSPTWSWSRYDLVLKFDIHADARQHLNSKPTYSRALFTSVVTSSAA